MPVRSTRVGFDARLLHGSWMLGAILSFAWVSAIQAQMPTTMLSSVFPPSGQAGAETELQITGDNMDEMSGLQFSHPGITATQKMIPPDEFSTKPTPIDNQFTVKIAPDVPPGIYEVRSVGRYGLSNPRAFVVDDLKQVKKEGSPYERETAMPVEVGSTVSAQIAANRVEYYAVEFKKDDRVLIDCWGERIDSRIDPVVRLYDPNGRMVRRARQADPRDSLIQWKVQKEGKHIVAVSDFTYQGGADYAYRLSFRKAPYIDFIFPPVGLPGSNGQYTIYGRNLPGGQPVKGYQVRGVELEKSTVSIGLPSDAKSLNHLPMTEAVGSHQAATSGFPYRLKGKDGLSNTVTVHFAEAPIVLEQEPANNEQATPQKVAVPCEYVGQFYPERDRDWIAFDAKKGEVFWINVFSQRLGTAADPVMMIEKVTKDAKGNEQVRMITKLDDVPYTAPANNQPDILSLQTDDPKYRLAVDEDATYRIRLNDLYNNPANDPRLVYRLVIQKENPDFQLMAYALPEMDARRQMKPTACVVRRGGTAVVNVNIARQYGFDNDVEITVEGLPQGVTCQGAKLGGKVDEGWLVFQADEKVAKWAGPIRIVGKAVVNGKPIERQARYGSLLWPVVQNMPVSSRLVRDMTLSVVTAETFPVTLEAGDGKVIETSLGAKLEIPLKVTTREAIKGDLKVSAVSLHRDITRKDVTVKTTAKTELYFRTTNIPVGYTTFYFQGLSKFSYKRNQDAINEAKAEQKRAAELKKKYDAEAKTAQAQAATETKNATTAAAELKAAQKNVQTAAQSKDKAKIDAAQKALKEAEQKNQVAGKAKQDADAAAKKLGDLQKKADAYIKKVDALLKTATAQNKTADINLYVASTPVIINVNPHPLKIAAPSTLGKLQAEKTLELPVAIERLYGFADKVDIDLVLPSGVKGITADKASLDKNKKDAKLTIKAAKTLTPGTHTATLRLQMRFNNVSLVAEQPVTFEAEAPKEVAKK